MTYIDLRAIEGYAVCVEDQFVRDSIGKLVARVRELSALNVEAATEAMLARMGEQNERDSADRWREHAKVESPQSNVNEARRILGPHVVSKLTDAGYSIVPAESAWTLSRAQSLAFGTERMDSGDAEYSRGYNTAVDCFRDVLRVADVEGEKP